MGGFLKAKNNRTLQETQRKSHQKYLGVAGVSLLVLGAIMLYFSSPISGALLVTLGAATAGYIPWIHAPTKPLSFSWMPEHTSQPSKHTTYPLAPKPPSPVAFSRKKASDSKVPPTSEDMLRVAGGEKPILSFSPTARKKSFEKLSAVKTNEDTFDLIAQLPTKSPR
tara:strand:- start:22787 stop:23287 length:501 start_codon:yes stop_codon:yes gene_type:complete